MDFTWHHVPRSSNGIKARHHGLSVPQMRGRLFILSFISLLWVGILIYRLLDLQVFGQKSWQEWALRQHLAEIQLSSERGPMFDRKGRLLAVSVPAGSVYARPNQIRDRDAFAKTVSPLLKIPVSEIIKKITKPSPFVWLVRQIPRQQAEQIDKLGIGGLGYVIEAKRYYPYNKAASALIGKVGTDGNGLSGLEMRYDKLLHADTVTTITRRDALGKSIDLSHEDTVGDLQKGNSLALTLDANLQLILDDELEAGRSSAEAKATLGVMLDAKTGEILAMGQSPMVNFNAEKSVSKADLKNLVLETIFEPGSILKPLVAAAALDQGIVTPDENIDCGNGRLQIGRSTIKDVHPFDSLRFTDVIVRSSNIGMSRIGLRMGKEHLYHSLKSFGFASDSGLSLPGMTDGILRSPSRWALIDEATHSFGHGLAVTPLQMVRAISAIAHDGILPQPSLLLEPNALGLGDRVFSSKTANQVKDMMYAVVEDPKGTGHKAAIDGVRVAGKTGTAQKPKIGGRGYEEGAYVSSFVGFVDAKPLGVDRIVTLIVVVDEPRAGSIFGGAVAAPVFQKIMQRTLNVIVTDSVTNELMPRDEIQRVKPALLHQVSFH